MEGLSDIGGTLSKHYGPLPGYAWVGIGGLSIAILVKLRGGSASPSAADLGAAAPASDGSLGAGDSGGGGGGATFTPDSGVATDPSALFPDLGPLIPASQARAAAPGDLVAAVNSGQLNPNTLAEAGLGPTGVLPNNTPTLQVTPSPSLNPSQVPKANQPTVNPNEFHPFQPGGVSGTQTQALGGHLTA